MRQNDKTTPLGLTLGLITSAPISPAERRRIFLRSPEWGPPLLNWFGSGRHLTQKTPNRTARNCATFCERRFVLPALLGNHLAALERGRLFSWIGLLLMNK